MKTRITARVVVVWVAVLAVGAALTSSALRDTLFYFRDHLLYRNFHEVVPGRFYRSAAMPFPALISQLRKYRIKTVIDLRYGGDRREARQLRRAGVEYVHVGFKSNFLPSQRQIRLLLEAFERSRRPVLIHCISGQNRSSVASAIWMLTEEHKSIPEAFRQLSPRYGFFKFARSYRSWRKGKPLLEEVLYQYAADYQRQPEPFRRWARRWQALQS